MAAALRLIERDGAAAFSLREAARDVGVSANATYRHFADKAALMDAAAIAGFERLAERMRGAMERAVASRGDERPTVARFKAVGRAYVEFAVAHPQLFRLMFGERGVRGMPDAACATPVESPWLLLGRSLDALVDDGVVTAEQRVGAELKAWVVVHGFASLTLDGLVVAEPGGALPGPLESLLAFTVLGLSAPPHV